MILQVNNNLYLESLADKHAQPLYELANRNRDHLGAWLPWVKQMQDAGFISNFIKSSMHRYSQGTEEAFVIYSENKVAGRIGLYKIDSYHRTCEIGYWIGKEFEGKGFVTQGAEAIMHHARKVHQTHRIEIRCAADNMRSKKIPLRLEFAYEGTLREAEIMHGSYIDIEVYANLQQA